MVYFIPFIAAIDGEGAGYALLKMNLYLNLIPAVLTAIALFVVAINWGVRHPWLALIPVADLWVLGKITDTYHLHVRKKEKKMRYHLPALGAGALVSLVLFALVTWVLEMISSWNSTFWVVLLMAYAMVGVWGAFMVFRYIAICDLYRAGTSGKEGRHMVLSFFFPFLIPFFIFASR